MKRAFTLNYVLYGLVYLIIFTFVGVFNLAFAQWDFNALASADYWFKTASTSITYILAYQIAVNLSADIYTQTYDLYTTTLLEVERTVKTQVGPDFKDFIIDFNFRNKREVWETLISNKITKLDNRTSHRVFEQMRLKPESEWTEKVRKYLRKKAALQEQLKDEWIKKNLPYIKISYPQVTPQEVATGEIKPTNKKQLIDNNVATYGLIKKVFLLAATIGVNAVFTAMILTGSPFSGAVFIQLMFQLVMIGVNIISGFFTGVDGFKKKRLNSLYTRRDILIEYLSKKHISK